MAVEQRFQIEPGVPLVGKEGRLGKVDRVVADPATGRVGTLLVRSSLLALRDRVVPVEAVESADQQSVRVRLSREEFESLPEWLEDKEITAEVLDRLWYRSDLEEVAVRHVQVRTRDGVVELRGHTTDEPTRALIEDIARRVPGVQAVRNRLQTFESLAAALEQVS